MPSPISEVAVAVVVARLAAMLSGVAVERDRRSPVDVAAESLPRVVVRFAGLEADAEQEPGYTHYRLELLAEGYARAGSDAAAWQALAALHASVVAALAGWTPDTPGLGDVTEGAAELRLYDTEESAKPAGEFAARFAMLAHTQTGNPYL